MATQAQIEQAKALAKKLGYSVTVSPALTKQNPSNKSLEEKISQLEMENRLLKAHSNNRGQRTSLVESNSQVHHSNGYSNHRNALQERLSSLDWQHLADREQPLPENVTVEQLLKDFGHLYLMKTGHYGEI